SGGRGRRFHTEDIEPTRPRQWCVPARSRAVDTHDTRTRRSARAGDPRGIYVFRCVILARRFRPLPASPATTPLRFHRIPVGMVLTQQFLDLDAIDGRRVARIVVELEVDTARLALESAPPLDQRGELRLVVKIVVLLGDAGRLAAQLLEKSGGVAP